MKITLKVFIASVISLFILIPAVLFAQDRTLEELKEELLKRAQTKRGPMERASVDEVKLFNSRLTAIDPEQWGREWMRIAEPYEKKADALLKAGKKKEAAKTYDQAYHYYRIGRYPVPHSPAMKEAYQAAVRTFLAAQRLEDPPLKGVTIPFEGGKEIKAYLRIPKGVKRPPVILHWGGIDGWKEDRGAQTEAYLAAGWASLVVDLPGTGESPVLAMDGDKLFAKVLDHLKARTDIDGSRVAVQGSSWGGYWAAKLAHTEKDRIKAAVNWGGPIHYYFQPEWQRKALNTREYLIWLFQARSAIYGVKTVDEYLEAGPKFSLKTQGILDKPSAPILSVNGKNDTQVPISDLYILTESGSPKLAWVNPAGGHMGRGPGGGTEHILKTVVVPWLKVHLGGLPRGTS